jgi:hypothetical protein
VKYELKIKSMKKYIKYVKQVALGSVLGIALWACSDMNELSDRFLDKGETVYAAKVDSVALHAGYKKVEVELYINTRKIDTVKVYWDDYQQFVNVPVSNQQGVYRTVIDNLEESAYIFHLVSLDSYGNKSLPVEVSGEAFGDNRVSLLRSRNIALAKYSYDNGGEVIINWGGEVENSTGCRLAYTNTANEPAIIDVPPDETTTVIPDWKTGLRYSTQFVLGEGSLRGQYNTSEAGLRVLKEVLPKAGWSASASSSHAGFSPGGLIDGNPMVPWHSNASGGNMPQWITIDFGSGNARHIDGIVFQGRIDDITDKGFPKRIVWEVSDDNAEWTTILSRFELDYPTSQEPNPLWLPCSVPAAGRYLRCTISETWPNSRSWTYIGEMGIYQEVE